MDLTADVPSGTLLLKRKTKFRVARTIVDYSRCALSSLLKAVSIVLQEIIFAIWPHTMGHLSIPQIWKSVHSFLKDAQENATDLDLSNDDLVGFFQFYPSRQNGF